LRFWGAALKLIWFNFEGPLVSLGVDRHGHGVRAGDHLAVAWIGVNFEHFTEIGNCRVRSLKASFGDREARQPGRPFPYASGAMMR
jgi:hypothetical protein